jgi:hypothetical protein
MDNGVPLTPLINATHPITFSHFMGTNFSMFLSGMKNHNTQSAPWASNNPSLHMPKMSSHFPSSCSSSYVNMIFGSRGMMPPFSPFPFDQSPIPQPNLIVGGWNSPPHGSNPIFTFPKESS